jgi:transcription antitermination factor NusG
MSPRPSRFAADPRWYALAVETRGETVVARKLDHARIEHYLPLEERRQHRAGRAVTVRRRAFLPGYLFVRLPRPAFFLDDARGVIGLVRMGERAIAVPEAAVASLRALEDADGVIRAGRRAAARFAPGQRVRVTDGAWSGFTGEILALTRRDRVRLLLGALTTEMPARLLARDD